jgi:hypothetical protein
MASPDTGDVNDECCILVAGVKMVCQSMDLVEDHVFIELESHLIKPEAIQLGYRGYRLGQRAPPASAALPPCSSEFEVSKHSIFL